MTWWWLLAGAVGWIWALWERARGAEARALRQRLVDTEARADRLRAELAMETQRTDTIHGAALTLTENCRAEIPKIIMSATDPVERGRLASEFLDGLLERTIAITSAAAARASGVVPGKDPPRLPPGGPVPGHPRGPSGPGVVDK